MILRGGQPGPGASLGVVILRGGAVPSRSNNCSVGSGGGRGEGVSSMLIVICIQGVIYKSLYISLYIPARVGIHT